ncbi:MAG: LysR substrate-binding domain-containing protein [Comamonadaceae bacterium]|nr:LysR substrate-binding domain-containing protein [Comamonadaceae bacterium]
MSDFDIPLLRTFASVADSGGFARAGERVHRTQSTVSQQIKKLEEQAGRQLLVRSARATQLTADGERMLGYARRILALHDEARNLFAEDLPELVRIGLVEEHAAPALPRLLGQVAARHPRARLEVRSALSLELAAELAAGRLDVALYRRLPGHSAEAGGADIAAWADTPQWMAAPAHAAALAAQPVLPLVLFPHGCVFRAHALAQLQALGRRWRLVYTSASVASVVAAVQAGLGVSLLSRHMLPAGGWPAPGALAVLDALGALDARSGLPAPPATRLVLRAAPGASGPAARAVLARLRGHLRRCMATA